MKQLFYLPLFLSITLLSCSENKRTIEDANDLNHYIDSITIESLDNTATIELGHYDKFGNFYNNTNKVVSEFAYIELIQNSNQDYDYFLPSIYWLRNGEEYLGEKDTNTDRIILRSKNNNPETDSEAMFFSELTDSLYLNLEYLKVWRRPTGFYTYCTVPLLEISPYQKKINQILQKQKENLNLLRGTEQMQKLYNDTYNKQIAFLERRKHKVSTKFYSLAKAYFSNEYANLLCSFSSEQEDNNASGNKLESHKAEVINDSLFFAWSYRSSLTNYFRWKNQGINKNGLIPLENEIYEILDTCNFSKENDEYILFTLINLRLDLEKEGDKSSASINVDKYLSRAENEDYRNFIRSKVSHKEYMKSILKGESLSEDQLFTHSSNTISLNEVIKLYRGKIIYLDFWASWCAPCRVLMPKSRELHVKHKDEVVFLYISIDEDMTAWKRAADEEKLREETSFLISNQSDFAKQHTIKTIPRYMIFDREGRLVDDNAPRPDDKEFENKMKSLLK